MSYSRVRTCGVLARQARTWMAVLTVFVLLVHNPATADARPLPRPAVSVPGGITTSRRIVALTFDDGPSGYTAQILAALNAFRVHATFFEIGRQVPGYSPSMRALLRAGDEIGNHGYTHANLLYLTDAGIWYQLQQTQIAIRAASGVQPRWLRPPDGAVDARVVNIAAGLGLRTVLWSVDPRDWSRPGSSVIAQRVVAQTRPGAIILLHDGGGDRSQTVAALPAILRTLHAEGYQIVTVSTLFGLAPVSSCDETKARTWFATDGVQPAPTHAIYPNWLRRLCNGQNFFPATSREHSLSRYVVAQNFAHTAHRIEWDRRSGAIHVSIIWSWATAVFTADHIQPQWGTPITHAWFDQYFNGHNWGPAREPPRSAGGTTTQCFQYGCAAARSGIVAWTKR